MSDIKMLDRILCAALAIIIVTGIILAQIDETVFRKQFVNEDGVLEYATAILLLCVSVLSFYRLATARAGKGAWFLITTGFFAVMFFFGAGEEVSWGQRIFGIESGEFFKENNAQSETNLHNLMVGDTKINKLIFGKLMTLILLTYFVIIPVITKFTPALRNLFDTLYVPFPRLHHSWAFVLGGLAILLVDSSKKGELNEMCLSILFFMVMTNPANLHIYKR